MSHPNHPEYSSMTTTDVMDLLQIMDSQIKNGGFYQWYYNVVEHDRKSLTYCIHLVELGRNLGYENFTTLFSLLDSYETYVKRYEEDLKGLGSFVEEGGEDTEDSFVSDLERLDDLYYKEDWLDRLEKLAIQATSPIEITYIAQQDQFYKEKLGKSISCDK